MSLMTEKIECLETVVLSASKKIKYLRTWRDNVFDHIPCLVFEIVIDYPFRAQGVVQVVVGHFALVVSLGEVVELDGDPCSRVQGYVNTVRNISSRLVGAVL